MPLVTQLCNRKTINEILAELLWDEFRTAAAERLGNQPSSFFSGDPQFVAPHRLSSRDMVFVAHLGDTPWRTQPIGRADSHALNIAYRVAVSALAVELNRSVFQVGVQLVHGTVGWGEQDGRPFGE